jgi:hypothetical protein
MFTVYSEVKASALLSLAREAQQQLSAHRMGLYTESTPSIKHYRLYTSLLFHCCPLLTCTSRNTVIPSQ